MGVINMESAIHRLNACVGTSFLAGAGEFKHLEELEPGVIGAINIKGAPS